MSNRENSGFSMVTLTPTLPFVLLPVDVVITFCCLSAYAPLSLFYRFRTSSALDSHCTNHEDAAWLLHQHALQYQSHHADDSGHWNSISTM